MAKEILKIKPKNTEPAEILRNEKLVKQNVFKKTWQKRFSG